MDNSRCCTISRGHPQLKPEKTVLSGLLTKLVSGMQWKKLSLRSFKTLKDIWKEWPFISSWTTGKSKKSPLPLSLSSITKAKILYKKEILALHSTSSKKALLLLLEVTLKKEKFTKEKVLV